MRLPLACIIIVVLFYSCQKKAETKNTLFRIVQPKHSGIKFANQLEESDTFNSVFYEYYYNVAGLAIADQQ